MQLGYELGGSCHCQETVLILPVEGSHLGEASIDGHDVGWRVKEAAVEGKVQGGAGSQVVGSLGGSGKAFPGIYSNCKRNIWGSTVWAEEWHDLTHSPRASLFTSQSYHSLL